jgi:hypothetical protein
MAAMGLVGAVLSATAMSWHGILLSETARLAPFGSAGAVTGGVLSFGQIRRVTRAVCFRSPAAPAGRLQHRLGPVRSSGSVGE